MIPLVLLEDARQAHAFVDYLATRQIPCQISQSELGVSIVLYHAEHLLQAQQELQRFINEPNHPRYMAASWQVGKAQQGMDYRQDLSAPLVDFFRHAGPLTLLILALCLALYLLQTWGGTLYENLRFPADIMVPNGQIWRYFTPALLHFSLLHLIFNLLWWWYFAGQIEQHIGSGKLTVLLLVTAILPNVAEYLVSGPYFGGLSGVVYGLLGYCWVRVHQQPHSALQLPPAMMGFMLVWLVLGFMDLLGQKTANMAHLVGLCVGLAQGWLDRHRLIGSSHP